MSARLPTGTLSETVELLAAVQDTKLAVLKHVQRLDSIERTVADLTTVVENVATRVEFVEAGEQSGLPREHIEQMIRDCNAITGSILSLVQRVSRLERQVFGSDALDDEWARLGDEGPECEPGSAPPE